MHLTAGQTLLSGSVVKVMYLICQKCSRSINRKKKSIKKELIELRCSLQHQKSVLLCCGHGEKMGPSKPWNDTANPIKLNFFVLKQTMYSLPLSVTHLQALTAPGVRFVDCREETEHMGGGPHMGRLCYRWALSQSESDKVKEAVDPTVCVHRRQGTCICMCLCVCVRVDATLRCCTRVNSLCESAQIGKN